MTNRLRTALTTTAALVAAVAFGLSGPSSPQASAGDPQAQESVIEREHWF